MNIGNANAHDKTTRSCRLEVDQSAVPPSVQLNHIDVVEEFGASAESRRGVLPDLAHPTARTHSPDEARANHRSPISNIMRIGTRRLSGMRFASPLRMMGLNKSEQRLFKNERRPSILTNFEARYNEVAQINWGPLR